MNPHPNNTPQMMITRRQATKLLNTLKQELENNMHIPVTQTANISCGNGALETDNNKPLQMYMGTQEIEEYPKLYFGKINPYLFLSCVVAGFHEQQHFKQRTEMFCRKNPTNTEVYMSLNQMVCDFNEDYYMYSHNYYSNPTELDAEKHGIQNACEFLQQHFPKFTHTDCENIMVDYVNYRMQYQKHMSGYSLIPVKEYTSLDEIYQAFDTSLKESISKPRMYYVGSYSNSKDVAMSYLYLHDKNTQREKGHSVLHDHYLTLKTGQECDMMIASITKLKNPYCTDGFPYLTNMDLSPETIIGIALPNDPTDTAKTRNTNYRFAELEAQYKNKFDPPQPKSEDDLNFRI